MSQYSKIKEELLASNDLKLLTQAYQEHAIEQINFARYSVLSSREFAEELEEIFYNVKSSYRNIMLGIMKSRYNKKPKGTISTAQTEVLVLITANNILYGDIINKICNLYYERAKNSKADLVVIGKQGKKFLEQTELRNRFTYFEIPDNKLSFQILRPLTDFLMPYDRVTVFHGKFNNIISQEPISASVSGDISDQTVSNQQEIDFLFEPSLENIVTFFETQIFSLLLSQSIHEAQLSRYASRVSAMETAQNNMQKYVDQLLKKERRIKALEANKKQLQLFAGKMLWGKKLR